MAFSSICSGCVPAANRICSVCFAGKYQLHPQQQYPGSSCCCLFCVLSGWMAVRVYLLMFCSWCLLSSAADVEVVDTTDNMPSSPCSTCIHCGSLVCAIKNISIVGIVPGNNVVVWLFLFFLQIQDAITWYLFKTYDSSCQCSVGLRSWSTSPVALYMTAPVLTLLVSGCSC